MRLHETVIKKIYEHAMEEYPDECCGIIISDVESQTVQRCTNIQNQLHAEDPVRFPRNAHTAYTIDRGEFDAIIGSAQAQGKEVIALYHSHCDHESYFSEEDVAAQTVFGEPEFPDALHIVASVMDGRVHDIRCFIWDRERQIFFALDCC